MFMRKVSYRINDHVIDKMAIVGMQDLKDLL